LETAKGKAAMNRTACATETMGKRRTRRYALRQEKGAKNSDGRGSARGIIANEKDDGTYRRKVINF